MASLCTVPALLAYRSALWKMSSGVVRQIGGTPPPNRQPCRTTALPWRA
ncbi:hypothetical protein L665_01000 [Ralstonia solanacearum SD54]|nr:hypothetical protein L665_01000 [Ralstonia solanacearum SD54]